MINYVTDGGPSQFKNRQNILNLTFYEADFGVPAIWSFSATSHGKGPVDGLGAALKSTATRYLLRHGLTEVFKSPKELYEFSKQRQDFGKSNRTTACHIRQNTRFASCKECSKMVEHQW